ncbi:MAG: hypothetical protein Q8R37_04740 [Nanoarchaeota archaeon]|nr:hypothetical protein [Nanoarchaeota archaeon]
MKPEEIDIVDDTTIFEAPEESKWKKIVVFIMGIGLLMLLFFSIFSDYPLAGIIRGQLQSAPLENNVITLDGFSIIFENDVHRELQQIYFAEQKVEFSVCLQGANVNADYYIHSFYQPVMYEQSFNHVIFEPCSSDSLIILHSHPYKSCLASQTDLKMLKQSQEKNPAVLMVVMCEPARFSVYD